MRNKVFSALLVSGLITSLSAFADEFEADSTLTDVNGDAISGVALSAGAAADSSEAVDESSSLLESVMTAIRPEGDIPPLANDRLVTYLSDEVLFLQFERNAARYDFESARANMGLMITEERDTVFQVGLALDAPSDFISGVRFSAGTRLYVALLGIENNDAFAAAMGIEAAYVLPFERAPLEFSTSFYYAPDVLTFGQGDRVVDLQIDVSIPFRPQMDLFTGIRYLQIDTRPDDREIDNRWHVGLRWNFL